MTIMLGRLLTALSTVVASAFAAPPTAPIPDVDWVVDLRGGKPVDVVFQDGALRPTATNGLVALPAHRVAQPVGRVTATLDADLPAGTSVDLDLRGRLLDGRWTEWRPSTPGSPVDLPGPALEVQSRLLLTRPDPGRVPAVRALRLRGEIVRDMRVDSPTEPATYDVFATRLGLVHGRTANGHRIAPEDYFVALPSRRSLAEKGGAEYSVKVCAAARNCAWVPVWDVGPWNTRDDYWSAEREAFDSLPRGLPAAQAAFADGHNGGLDGKGRKVLNPAGIDLSDRVFTSALKLTGNAQVTVTYLWTGPLPLSRVDTAEDMVTVRTAPSDGAAAAGVAADETGVPVECIETPDWLRIGPEEYLPADDVRLDEDVAVGPC